MYQKRNYGFYNFFFSLDQPQVLAAKFLYLMCYKWTRVFKMYFRIFFQHASSLATGTVLQRFATIALRRPTRGVQFQLMWRQWFYFSRMFGIAFPPAQSGKPSPEDTSSSWWRSFRVNARRLMENRHWTLIPFSISASHRHRNTGTKHSTHYITHTHGGTLLVTATGNPAFSSIAVCSFL